jgi:hypothetical protein
MSSFEFSDKRSLKRFKDYLNGGRSKVDKVLYLLVFYLLWFCAFALYWFLT